MVRQINVETIRTALSSINYMQELNNERGENSFRMETIHAATRKILGEIMDCYDLGDFKHLYPKGLALQGEQSD